MSALQRRPTAELLELLLLASRLWAGHRPVDLDEIAELRREVLCRRHRTWLDVIPAYAAVAAGAGVGPDATFEALARELVLDVGVFKSYDGTRVAAGALDHLDDWLAQVSALDRPRHEQPVEDLAGWIESLRRQGVAVAVSSGTSGKVAFVPRDGETRAALYRNGRFYAHATELRQGRVAYDCLVLGPRSQQVGVLAAGYGLASSARRQHFLTERPLDIARLEPGQGERWAATVRSSTDEELAAASWFLRRAAAEAAPCVVFGPPATLAELCGWLLARDGPVPLPPGSLVLTGGGWKAEAAPEAPLDELVAAALAVPPERRVDSYGATELNVVLSTCTAGRYHVPPLVELVILDSELRPVAEPEATGLVAIGDPFTASYCGFLAPGDVATRTTTACPCGLTGPSLVGAIARAPGYEAKGCAGTIARALA